MAERNKRFYIWDLKELNGFTHTSMVVEPFNMWPSGNCGHVYSASSQQAKRHISGWAMRNTNNHNINILKKSCLGVLVCNRSCQRADSTPVAVRPAICDKARRKQIGRKCPNGCGGMLILQQCKGHNGYPVTHFWRHYEDKVFFIGKGFHDHPKPEVKLTSEKRRAYTKNPNRVTRSRTRHSYVPPSAPAVSSALSGLHTADSTMLYQTQGSNSNTTMNYYAALCNQNSTNYSQPPPPLANQHFQQQQQQLLLERHLQNQLQVQQTIQLQQLQNSYSSYPSCQYQQQDLRRKYYEPATSSMEKAANHVDNSLNALWSSPTESRSQSSYTDSTSDSRYRFLRQNTISSYSSNSAVLPSPLTATSYPSLGLPMKPSYYPYQTGTQLSNTTTALGEEAAILDLSLVPNAASTWRSDNIFVSSSSSEIYGSIKYASTCTSTTTSSVTTADSSTLYIPKVTPSSGSLEIPKFMSFPALMDGLDQPVEDDGMTASSSTKDLPKVPAKSLDANMVPTSQQQTTTIQELIDIENMDMGDISNIVNLSASTNRPPPNLISDQPTATSNASSLPALSSFLRGIEYL